MIKTFMFNVENLSSDQDTVRIKKAFESDQGVVSVETIIGAAIVSIKYDDQLVTHTQRLIDELNHLGYYVK